MSHRRRRTTFFSIVSLLLSVVVYVAAQHANLPKPDNNSTVKRVDLNMSAAQPGSALQALGTIAVKGKAAKTGYSRDQFGDGWIDTGGCNMRERILARDMTGVQLYGPSDCRVTKGSLNDPYTGREILFIRGPGANSSIQIDHVVALSNAWQTGAQQLTAETRKSLANDPLELLAVDGPANMKKGDGDTATWLPANQDYRCRYVARQIAVKQKYKLWVTSAEQQAMQGVLSGCADQPLPVVLPAT